MINVIEEKGCDHMRNSLLPETVFDARKTPWYGLGTEVKGAATSADAMRLSGLDWNVVQKKIYDEDNRLIPGQFANVRDSDGSCLGIVGERYKVVQNSEAFEFTDALLGEGVKYETAGALNEGRKIWLLAILPEKYKILGDNVDPYVVFSSSHDGSGSIKVAVTPIRVWCKNTLNLSLKRAKRTWTARHTMAINTKMDQARATLKLSHAYMDELNSTFEDLYKVKIDKDKMIKLVDDLVPIEDDATDRVKNNINRIKSDIIFRWEEAPDLKDRERTGARFIQAVTDSVTHIEPARLTQNYQANLWGNMINGNALADRAMQLVMAA